MITIDIYNIMRSSVESSWEIKVKNEFKIADLFPIFECDGFQESNDDDY